MRPQAIRLVPRRASRYETKDIKVSYVALTGIGVMGLLVALLLFLVWLEPFLFHGGYGDKSPIMWGKPLPVAALPREPRLELSGEADYAAMRSAWDRELETYGRTPAGEWRIPVAKAMEELAARSPASRGGAK